MNYYIYRGPDSDWLMVAENKKVPRANFKYITKLVNFTEAQANIAFNRIVEEYRISKIVTLEVIKGLLIGFYLGWIVCRLWSL